jgi:hypothetical protein
MQRVHKWPIVKPGEGNERMREPVVPVNHLRLLKGDDSAKRKRSLWIRHWRGVPPPVVAIETAETGRRRCEAMDRQRTDALDRGRASVPDGRDRDVVATAGETSAQVLYDRFLSADNRRIELGDHQDAHAGVRTIAR